MDTEYTLWKKKNKKHLAVVVVLFYFFTFSASALTQQNLPFIYSKMVTENDIVPVREKPKSYLLFRKRLSNDNSKHSLHIETAKPIPLDLSKYMTVWDNFKWISRKKIVWNMRWSQS